MRWLIKTGIAGGVFFASIWGLAASAEEGAATKADLAAKNLKSIEAAVQDFKDKCGVDFLKDDDEAPSLPDKVDCGKGPEPLGAAWVKTLAGEGVPDNPDDRQTLAEQLGLSPSMTLILVEGTARGDAIENLMNALLAAAGKDK